MLDLLQDPITGVSIGLAFTFGIILTILGYGVASKRQGEMHAELKARNDELESLAESLELKEEIENEVEQSIINDDMQSRINELRDLEG